MRRLFLSLIAVFLIAGSAFAEAGDKLPKDFKLVFRSSAGALERASQETVEVVKGTVTVSRNVELVGEDGVKTKDQRSYKISDEQLQKLYDEVLSSGFFSWPKSAQAVHTSTVEEFFDITADGKTITHGRWEQGNQEAFRSFYDRYNAWFNGIRTVRF